MRVSRTFTVSSTIFFAMLLAACAQTTTKPQATPPAAAPAAAPQTQKPAAPPTAAAPAPAGAAAQAKPPQAPKPLMATSPDGTKIAYEVTGTGPALILVHGNGQTRSAWKQLGYVDRLSKRFTVIIFDLRGIGDSDKPATQGSYALDKVLGDVLAVADAAKAQRFHVYGFGHGATIARYLAARSDRVSSAVLVGATMGPAVTGVFKDAISAMQKKWQPLIEAHSAGTLDVSKLSSSDRAAWDAGIAVTVLSLVALLEYPPLEPADVKAPTLWAVGSDDSAMENVKEYEAKLKGTAVTLKVLSSVNYSDSFTKVDQVMTEVEPFLTKPST